MTHSSTNKSCPYSPHSGPVGCLPAPNIFPLAKETFAKGKMFWNYKIINNFYFDKPNYQAEAGIIL